MLSYTESQAASTNQIARNVIVTSKFILTCSRQRLPEGENDFTSRCRALAMDFATLVFPTPGKK